MFDCDALEGVARRCEVDFKPESWSMGCDTVTFARARGGKQEVWCFRNIHLYIYFWNVEIRCTLPHRFSSDGVLSYRPYPQSASTKLQCQLRAQDSHQQHE